MSEIASEIADAIREHAEATRRAGSEIAGALCYLAATHYTGTAGEQRQIAAVMKRTIDLNFGGVKYDGRPINQADIETADKLWTRFAGGRQKR